MVPFNMMVYLEDEDKYYPDDEVPKGARVRSCSTPCKHEAKGSRLAGVAPLAIDERS